jgi:hypothetical protein
MADDLTDISRVWEKLNAHDNHLSELTAIVRSSVKRQEEHSEKLDRIERAVTEHTAAKRPTLTEYMGTFVLLLTIVGGLALGISSYVGSLYDAKITTIEANAVWARDELAKRNDEDRAELIGLRQAREVAVASRLMALEQQNGWAPQQVTRGP